MTAVTRKPDEQALALDAPVLAYARFHRICRDYARDNPLDSRYLPQAPIFLAQELSDPSGCPQVQLNQPPGTSERLEIDSAAAHVLKSVSALRNPPQVTESYWNPHLTRQLKVETPLLRTDHDLDALRFRKRNSISLSNVTLPLEHTDDEQDEGLSWPSRCRNFPKEFHDKIASDKLDVQKKALVYLQSVVKRPDKPELPDPAHAKRRVVQPITPPLLPFSPEFTLVPDPSSSSPTGQLELLSGTTNSTAAEAEALEAEILKKDRIEMNDVPGLKSYTEDPMLWDDVEDLEADALEFTLKTRRCAAELKVEAPLTPPTSFPAAFQSPAKIAKSVSFPEVLLEYITYPEEIPSKYEDGNAVLDSENDFDAFFEEDIAPIAKKADWRAEHEQLQEADTTKRVEVPHLDFEAPIAPWHAFGLRALLKKDGISTELQAQARLLSRCANEELKLAQKWPESKKQDGELTWWAFPRDLSKSAGAEKIQHDAALNQVIGSSSLEDDDVVESGSLAWKLEGLRILDQPEDEDEELLPWHFGPGEDLATLLQKRKLEMANASGQPIKLLEASVSKDNAICQPQKKQKTNESDVHGSTQVENRFMLGGIFSTSGSLDQFMQISSGIMNVGQKSEIQYFPKEQQQEPIRIEASVPDVVKEVAGNSQSPIPVPAPPMTNDQPPKPFIISSSLLILRRELVQRIQRLYPRAILIERDFSKALSTNKSSPPAAEPDLLLSPSTGLLLTTLQRIKQRPLPGHQPSTTSAISFQAELAQRAAKVQHLIVLISASVNDPASITTTTTTTVPQSPDARDCEALASIQGFAASSRCRVTVAYVPGGEADLARWVVGAMEAYGRTSAELASGSGGDSMEEGIGGDGGEQSSVLKEEESLWELFLRRAGLNAFAAQVVLARLKKKEENGVGDGSAGGGGGGDGWGGVAAAAYGLAAFVGMTPEERMEVFEGVLGDRELLDVVGRRVDGLWTTPGSVAA